MSGFDAIKKFEEELGKVTGAPYVVMTDCCSHAIELCFRYKRIKRTQHTPFTYISVPMTLKKIGVKADYLDEKVQEWIGEYQFAGTNIWDSARLLQTGMYRSGQMQCLSFGHSKPLDIGRGGAILLDDIKAYSKLIRMRSDGRDLSISPWESQRVFELGFHYRPTIEEAELALEKLPLVDQKPKYVEYPDLRQIVIK